MKNKDTCDTCHKSGLSIALFRPSVVARHPRLATYGSQLFELEPELLSGLLPATPPTQSRPVLRLLRAGYLHVYHERPLPGGEHWQEYLVTDQAELVPVDMAGMLTPDGALVCQRTAHNVHALRSLHIANAQRAGKVWLAFSANLWSDEIRARNAADPAVMQCLDIPAILAGQLPRNAFRPTVAAFERQVVESVTACFIANEGAAELSPYRFVSLCGAGGTDAWIAALEQIAARHPATAGKALALVLSDPLGLAAELNALRLRQHALALAEMQRPRNAHAINSSNALMGLKSVMLDRNRAASRDTVAPKMSYGAFKDIMRANQRGWPADTEWKPLPDTPENRRLYRAGTGVVIFPDHQERSEAWAREQTEATWSRMTGYYDEEARATWMADFDRYLQEHFFELLQACEEDWLNAWSDARYATYLERHFDRLDRDDWLRHHLPGVIYAREVASSLLPQPHSRGKVLRTWVDGLLAEAGAPHAHLLRALAANQDEVIAATAKVYAVEDIGAVADYLHDNRNDKLYDLGKGLVKAITDGHPVRPTAMLARRFGWLGDALGGYATGIAMSAAGAVAALTDPRSAAALAAGASGLAHVAADSELGRRLLRRVQSIGAVRQALDLALQGVVQGGGLRTPVLIHRRMPIDEAMDLLRGRPGADTDPLRNQLIRHAHAMRPAIERGERPTIVMSALTDNQTLAALGGDLDALIGQGHGEVRLGSAARAQLAAAAPATVIVSEERFAELFRRQTQALARATAGVREVFSGAHATVRSLDARLALGVVIINATGVWNNLNNLEKAQDAIAVRDAWFGMMDAGAGTVGGLAELLAAAGSAIGQARTGAKVVVAENLKLTTLTGVAYIMGAVAGVVNGISALAKAEDAKRRGDYLVANLYGMSFASFVGMSAPYSALAAGVVADHLVKRGIGGAAVRAIAIRFGAEGVFSTALTGWGLALLGTGLLFEVGAIVIAPTPLQNWVRRTYFGTGGGDEPPFSKGDWAAEYAGLMETLKIATQVEEKERSMPPADGDDPNWESVAP